MCKKYKLIDDYDDLLGMVKLYKIEYQDLVLNKKYCYDYGIIKFNDDYYGVEDLNRLIKLTETLNYINSIGYSDRVSMKIIKNENNDITLEYYYKVLLTDLLELGEDEKSTTFNKYIFLNDLNTGLPIILDKNILYEDISENNELVQKYYIERYLAKRHTELANSTLKQLLAKCSPPEVKNDREEITKDIVYIGDLIVNEIKVVDNDQKTI